MFIVQATGEELTQATLHVVAHFLCCLIASPTIYRLCFKCLPAANTLADYPDMQVIPTWPVMVAQW